MRIKKIDRQCFWHKKTILTSKTNNENTTPNISDYKQNKDQNSSNGSNAQDNSNKQDNETSLPNLNLTSKKDQAKQNDEYYSETPSGITNHTKKGKKEKEKNYRSDICCYSNWNQLFCISYSK